MDPKIINFLTNFGASLGSIWGPELAQKGDLKLDQFWNPRGPGVAILGIKLEW